MLLNSLSAKRALTMSCDSDTAKDQTESKECRTYLAIVESAFNRDIMDVRIRDGRHLCLLNG